MEFSDPQRAREEGSIDVNCAAHRGLSVEEIGAVVYGPAWGQAAPGEL